MNKLFLAGILATSLIACNSKESKNEPSKSNAKELASENASNPSTNIKIRYYILDSVAENFEIYKQESVKFEKEGLNLQNQLAAIQNEYQRVYTAYESGMKKNILSPNQAAEYEQKLGGLQQRMAEFQNGKMMEFQQRQMEATTIIQNKINEYSRAFAQENNIDLFLINGTGGQVAYGNPSLDVTPTFVSYMNEKESEIAK